jgi:flagellar biogenesis protein FliO
MLLAASSALVLVEVGLVLAALAGVLAYLGRRARQADPQVLRTIRLSPQHAVYVVVIEDRRLVLGAGTGAAPTLLCDLGDRLRAVKNDVPREPTGVRSGAPIVAGGTRGRGGWDQGG